MNRVLKKWLLAFSGMFLTLVMHGHPIHVSYMNIERQKNGEWSILLKIYKDDFQKAMAISFDTIIAYKEMHNNPLCEKYIKQKVSLTSNGSLPVKIIKDSSFVDDDVFWITFQFKPVEKVEKIIIKNELLLDIYSDQVNLLIIHVSGKEKGYSFNIDQKEIEIDIS